MPDLVVRGGTLVTPNGVFLSDVAIADGRIESIGLEISNAAREIDARGLHVFPGVIDVHLHFNEPGRTEWEGAETGSRALAAGGGTTFFDMPLNSTPCTVNAHEFHRKRSALEAASIADFALWGGIVPGNLEQMAELAECGVIGFKAFMCDSGLPEFPRADDLTLLDGLREAARLKLPVAVHAENQELVQGLSDRLLLEGGAGVREFLASRPVLAEVDAIQRATLMAGETGAKLHIVHISSGRGVAAALEARARGVDVSIETCPHYLTFTEQDLDRLGTLAKCAPPLRSPCEQSALWDHLLGGGVGIVASDHSPAPPEMKSGSFLRAWGGIAGAQSTLPVLLHEGFQQRGLPLGRIASVLASEPARRFDISGKGNLSSGHDADLVLVDLSGSFTLRPEDLLQRHKSSPYTGRTFQGVIRRTIRRGETIFQHGTITATTRGRFIRPSPPQKLH